MKKYMNNANMTTKQKILFVIKTIERGGGAERVFVTIVDELRRYEKYDVTIMTFRSCEDEYFTNARRVNIGENKITKNIFLNFFKSLIRAKEISNYCKDNRVENVVCFMKESNLPGVLSKLFFGNQARITVSMHNSPEKEYSLLHRFLARTLYRYADNIITVSKEAANFFPKKAVAIYNPISISKNNADSNEEISSDFERDLFTQNEVIITVGRLTQQKNHLLLLDVFARCVADRPTLRLVILGEGPLRGILEDRIKELNLTGKVFLFGIKENIFKYLKHAKLFMLTSSFEGLSMVLLESMSIGVPVITNDCFSGPSEIVGDTYIHLDSSVHFLKDKYGIRVPFNDVREFVDAVKWLLDDECAYKKYGILSRKRAQDFDLMKIMKEWVQILG
jgi:glycosyltransferase involved in cell wall biosynthesis